MKIEREDLVTPANVATIVGLAMTLHGAANLDSLQGVIEVGSGRALDLIDGPLARKFHASRFGAALDGTSDKIATAGMLIGAYHYEAAPEALLGYVLLQNVVNAGLTLYAEKKGQNPESSFAGKRGMFFQSLSIAGFALASVVESPTAENGIEIAGTVSAFVGIILGTIGTYGYFKDAMSRTK
jgi:phosphatidylglycerophosphate synthase